MRRSSACRAFRFAALTFALTLPGVNSLPAQDLPAEASESTDQRPLAEAAISPSDEALARRRAYNLGMVMLGGILIAGIGLVAVVMLWGSRARRIARAPLPRVAPRDELWYLKSKKADQPAGESPQEDPG